MLALTNHDGRLVDLIVVLDRCRVAPPLINRDRFRKPVSTNSLEQEGFGSDSIAVRGQQKSGGVIQVMLINK